MPYPPFKDCKLISTKALCLVGLFEKVTIQAFVGGQYNPTAMATGHFAIINITKIIETKAITKINVFRITNLLVCPLRGLCKAAYPDTFHL